MGGSDAHKLALFTIVVVCYFNIRHGLAKVGGNAFS
jgi:hypothetical protein